MSDQPRERPQLTEEEKKKQRAEANARKKAEKAKRIEKKKEKEEKEGTSGGPNSLAQSNVTVGMAMGGDEDEDEVRLDGEKMNEAIAHMQKEAEGAFSNRLGIFLLSLCGAKKLDKDPFRDIVRTFLGLGVLFCKVTETETEEGDEVIKTACESLTAKGIEAARAEMKQIVHSKMDVSMFLEGFEFFVCLKCPPGTLKQLGKLLFQLYCDGIISREAILSRYLDSQKPPPRTDDTADAPEAAAASSSSSSSSSSAPAAAAAAVASGGVSEEEERERVEVYRKCYQALTASGFLQQLKDHEESEDEDDEDEDEEDEEETKNSLHVHHETKAPLSGVQQNGGNGEEEEDGVEVEFDRDPAEQYEELEFGDEGDEDEEDDDDDGMQFVSAANMDD
uniref:W2 domain-containing protein n=1 Tax=Chromera velia CCMP2878 TaxID=1169474 RepID=A0A0G4HD13_9ALVE|mmetsp:Transcript_38160/g.74953  ORF Transcript_38160/g.74953 Transcript_38160/m.74953 type:complete len:392 (-) Transcript_38160:67-1242(-)|eukprot:Cvel_26220.t1-p1 / transcript=Cvel_26220.t1 / gene=Cvel_26220 / organism=Chromera_velia_CCMP2878 / gene_product=hypothetical protein / transcript_product=hypothetical protein / location=Cvel_scaffold3090:13388-17533(-) / protein_length=391 / sequence_SO=supercontig / SO=protein_coding / is_pseudo=false